MPVVNVWLLSSKSALSYLLFENWERPCKYFPFPSGRILCPERVRKDTRGGRVSLLFWSALFPRFFCCVWPLDCQTPAAYSSQQQLGANSTSPRSFTVNSKVWCLSVDGFLDTLEAGFPASSTGKASQCLSAILWAVATPSPTRSVSSS